MELHRLVNGEIVVINDNQHDEIHHDICDARTKFNMASQWHSDMFRRIWSTKEFISEPYESEQEINSAAINANSGCQQEAIAILHWYWNTWNIISNATIDENTDVELFTASLPVFGQ